MVGNIYHECLGSQLSRIRKSRRIKQTDLSDLTRLSRITIRGVENGKGNLSSFRILTGALGLELLCSRNPVGADHGEFIANLRAKKNISQRALAAAILVSHPTIVNLETRGVGRLATLSRAFSFLGAKPRLLCQNEIRKFQHVSKSSASDEWYSPPDLLSLLTTAVGREFDLDPCSPTTNPDQAPVVASRYYTIEQDGLSTKWKGIIYMNPPYSSVKSWVNRARLSVQNNDASLVIGLVPARTDTRWWNEDVAGKADVFFLQGRLTFSGHKNSAPFPSAVVVWGGDAELIGWLKSSLKSFHMPKSSDY